MHKPKQHAHSLSSRIYIYFTYNTNHKSELCFWTVKGSKIINEIHLICITINKLNNAQSINLEFSSFFFFFICQCVCFCAAVRMHGIIYYFFVIMEIGKWGWVENWQNCYIVCVCVCGSVCVFVWIVNSSINILNIEIVTAAVSCRCKRYLIELIHKHYIVWFWTVLQNFKLIASSGIDLIIIV